MEKFPDVILADTALIANAPARMLASGIGDSLGFVIEGMISAKRLDQKTNGSAFAWANFEKSGEILFNQGYKAYLAAKAHCVNKDFSDVVEQIVFWNGLYGDMVECKSNIAHFAESLMPVEPHKFMHGEMVGYGVIPMLVAEGAPLTFIHQYIDFCQSINIPVTFKQFGIEEFDHNRVKMVAEILGQGGFVDVKSLKIDADILYKSILAAEEIVTDYLKNK